MQRMHSRRGGATAASSAITRIGSSSRASTSPLACQPLLPRQSHQPGLVSHLSHRPRHSRFRSLATSSTSSSPAAFRAAGVFPPIVTPFRTDREQNVDFERLANNVKYYARPENGLAGLVVLGTNGEFPLLSTDEKVRIFRTVKQAVDAENPKRKLMLIAGTGCVGTKETIELTNQARDIGFDAAMIVTPVAQNVNGFPIILYNVPPMAGNVAFTVPIIKEIAYKNANVVGVKDTSGNVVQLAETVLQVKKPLRAEQGREFSVLAGSGSYLYHALAAGADGGVMALANLLPKPLSVIYDEFRAADREPSKLLRCQLLQEALVEINQKVTAEYGTSGLKHAMDVLGHCYGGNTRRPLRPLPGDKAEDLKKCLDASLKRLKELGVTV